MSVNKELLTMFIPSFEALKKTYGKQACVDQTGNQVRDIEAIQVWCEPLEGIPLKLTKESLLKATLTVVNTPKFKKTAPSPAAFAKEIRKIMSEEPSGDGESPIREAYMLLHSYYGALWEANNPYGFVGAKSVWMLGIQEAKVTELDFLEGVKLIIKSGAMGNKLPKLHDLICFTLIQKYNIKSIRQLYKDIVSKKPVKENKGLVSAIVNEAPGGISSLNRENGEHLFYSILCRIIVDWHKEGAKNPEPDMRPESLDLSSKESTMKFTKSLLTTIKKKKVNA